MRERQSKLITAKRQFSPGTVDRADDRLIEREVEEVGAGRADDQEDTREGGRRRRGA